MVAVVRRLVHEESGAVDVKVGLYAALIMTVVFSALHAFLGS